MKKLFFLPCLIIGLLGCQNESKQKESGRAGIKMVETEKDKAGPADALEEKAVGNDVMRKSVSPGKPVAPQQAAQQTERKIVKEGEISFETKSIPETRAAIGNSLQRLGGYIAAENETNDSSDTRKIYVLKARIPEQNFETFLNGVSSNAVRVDTKNIRARDVTAQFIDYTIQLANKKKLEDRYVELLKKGTKMDDLLEIEDKINDIQTEIDTTQGQLNYLSRQVEFSSLDITFYTKPLINNNEPQFGARVVSALSGGWDVLVQLFFGCLAIWPLWILAGVSYWIYRGWRKRHPLVKQMV